MSKRQAINKGTCQLCGRIHKIDLRTGLVAKHGYTKQHGFFNGTCHGSGELPIEKSCDLLRAYVEQAWPAEVRRLRDHAASIRSGEAKLMIEIQRGGAWGPKTVEELVRVQRDTSGPYTKWQMVTKDYHGNENATGLRFYVAGSTAEKVEASLRDDKAKGIERQAAQIEQYIEQRRPDIENWAERRLLPL